MQKFLEFLAKRRWTAIFSVAGLILAVLLLTVGFWKTLMILVFAAVFGLAGSMLDRDGGASVRAFYDRLFHKRGQ